MKRPKPQPFFSEAMQGAKVLSKRNIGRWDVWILERDDNDF